MPSTTGGCIGQRMHFGNGGLVSTRRVAIRWHGFPSAAVGGSQMSVIAVWSPVDLVLSLVLPLGLAVHKGTALVVDLDPAGPPLPGRGDLASLVDRGPTEAELSPTTKGVAILSNGGVASGDSAEVIAALAQRWPNMVLRQRICLPPPPSPSFRYCPRHSR